MQKVILFGASGNLGKKIAQQLVKNGYDLTVVVRSEAKGKALSAVTNNFIVADVSDSSSLNKIGEGYDIVISALGKSVSLNDKSKASFYQVDFNFNKNILNFARRRCIQKFIYISAFHCEKYLHLEYFKAHYEVEQLIKSSGLNYSIIKPPALFSAFIDAIEMAKKGQLVTIGKGDKKTNPIYEGDLAEIVVDSIHKNNVIIEAGGKQIYTRKQLLELINTSVNKKKKLRTIPLGLAKFLLPLVRLFNKNTFDKIAFFLAVMQHDTIAPPSGEKSFEWYVVESI